MHVRGEICLLVLAFWSYICMCLATLPRLGCSQCLFVFCSPALGLFTSQQLVFLVALPRLGCSLCLLACWVALPRLGCSLCSIACYVALPRLGCLHCFVCRAALPRCICDLGCCAHLSSLSSPRGLGRVCRHVLVACAMNIKQFLLACRR